MNMSHTSVKLYQSTKIGEVTPLADVYLVETEDSDPPALNTCNLPSIDLTGSAISTPEHRELLALLQKYADLLATDDDPLGQISVVRRSISTDSPPIHQPVYCQPMALQSAINSEVQKMLQQGVIQHSFSPRSSQVVTVKMVAILYRSSQAQQCHISGCIPSATDRCNSGLPGWCYPVYYPRSCSGYWQVEVHSCDKAFSTAQCHFEFNVMLFGLTNTPATFQCLMECVLAGLSGEQRLIYLDGVIIF